MLIKDAVKVTGGLSSPSKTDYGYSIPTRYCITGSKLRKKKGSVCENCYAHERNRYRFDNVKKALKRRYTKLTDPEWISGMVTLIGKIRYFRWHDSGDIQSLAHLDNIVAVCRLTPNTRHWLPTKEWSAEGKGIVNRWVETRGSFPDNLCIRLSKHMVDEIPACDESIAGIDTWSGVTKDANKATCPATLNGGSCEYNDCRACWNTNRKSVVYLNH